MVVDIKNTSDVKFVLKVNDGTSIEIGASIFNILPNTTTSIEIGNSLSKKVNIGVDVLNAYINSDLLLSYAALDLSCIICLIINSFYWIIYSLK